MKKGTSLYLDIARILAALMVFAEHAREHTKNSFNWFWKGHPTWFHWSDPLSLVAGMVVFVLSGYVIAHVMATREKTLAEYTASRAARLYSVMIPALLLALITNYAEALRYPGAFTNYSNISDPVRSLGSLFFVTHFWIWPDLGLPNMPLWRLSYEVTYYIAAALIVFARGRTRILSLLALCLIAGPSIILLAPTWFVGYGAYHFGGRIELRKHHALLLWAASLVGMLVVGPHLEVKFRQHLGFLRMPDNSVGGLLAAYVEAFCFAVNILTINALSKGAEFVMMPFTKIIRWLGATTFALYMFHQPLLSVFTVYPVGLSYQARSSIEQALLLIGGTLLIVGTVGHLCERLKRPYKRFLLKAWARFTPPTVFAAVGTADSTVGKN
jgi:peptidoglycan/LPS O-acetylase OafA/YrhL